MLFQTYNLTATCSVDIVRCFCENSPALWQHQPINSWSSLALSLTGVGVLATRRRAPYAPLFASALIFSGLGSLYYHLALTRLGQTLDYLGVLSLLGTVLAAYYGTGRRIVKRPPSDVVLSVTFVAAALVGMLGDNPRNLYWFIYPAVLAGLVTFAWDPRGALDRRRKALGLMLGALGILLWEFDTNPLLCNPHSLFQGHAAWHVISAASLTMLFFARKKD